MIEYNNITHNSMTKKNNNRQTHPADPHDTSDASISRERFGRDKQTDSQSVRRGFHHQGPSHRRRRHAVHDEHEKEGAQRGRIGGDAAMLSVALGSRAELAAGCAIQ